MKQIYGIIGIIGLFLLLIGAVGVYAHNTDDVGYGMMSNTQGTYNDMMSNKNIFY